MARSLVPRSREARDDLPTDLVNSVRKLSGSVVLVIDDVHLLADSDVLPGLALLIHQAPAALRLILCGRSVPGLHLAKMRLSGYLSEVQGADLACTAQEAEAYFDALGLAAGPAKRDSLLRETEGWMAGARLAALIAARDGDLNVDAIAADPIVADYMRDEVLDRQPPEVRQFLRRTSVADRLTPGFADWLTCESGGARILDQLDRENSFVSRDREGKYRYHPFLRQVLLGELRREMPAEVPGPVRQGGALGRRPGRRHRGGALRGRGRAVGRGAARADRGGTGRGAARPGGGVRGGARAASRGKARRSGRRGGARHGPAVPRRPGVGRGLPRPGRPRAR